MKDAESAQFTLSSFSINFTQINFNFFLPLLIIFENFQHVDNFQQCWQFSTILTIFEIWTIVDKFWQVWPFLQFMTIVDNLHNFWQLWTILTIQTIQIFFYNFYNRFHHFDVWRKENPGHLWHLRHWLKFRQLRTWIHDNLCYLTIKSDAGQHSQFLQCLVT